MLFSELDFSVCAGEVLEITGENGSGKSTLLHCLAGLRVAESGDLRWSGMPISGNDAYFQALRYIGHKSAVKPAMTAVENLHAFAALAMLKCSDQQIVEALRILGLGMSLNLPARQLSAGQRRRIALARLALSPGSVWILDEPFSALDVQGREWVANSISEFCSNGGLVVMTTHHGVDLDGPTVKTLCLES